MRGRNDFLRNITPSAASYRPETGKTKNSPSFSFGKKSRGKVFVPVDFDSPGPGEYESKSVFSTRRKGFSFGLRVSLK